MTKLEFYDRCLFLYKIISGSGKASADWERDIIPFSKKFKPNFEELYKRYQTKKIREGVDEIPCFTNKTLKFIIDCEIVESLTYPNVYTN